MMMCTIYKGRRQYRMAPCIGSRRMLGWGKFLPASPSLTISTSWTLFSCHHRILTLLRAARDRDRQTARCASSLAASAAWPASSADHKRTSRPSKGISCSTVVSRRRPAAGSRRCAAPDRRHPLGTARCQRRCCPSFGPTGASWKQLSCQQAGSEPAEPAAAGPCCWVGKRG